MNNLEFVDYYFETGDFIDLLEYKYPELIDPMLGSIPCPMVDKILLDKQTGCWNWAGSTNQGGYGIIGYERRNYTSHRLAFVEALYLPAEEYVLDHLCRNRRCCNPRHLDPVTLQENIRRSCGKSRIPNYFRLYAYDAELDEAYDAAGIPADEMAPYWEAVLAEAERREFS